MLQYGFEEKIGCELWVHHNPGELPGFSYVSLMQTPPRCVEPKNGGLFDD